MLWDRVFAFATFREAWAARRRLYITFADAYLRQAGASDVVAYVTHGVLSGGAVARVEGSELTELVATATARLRR